MSKIQKALQKTAYTLIISPINVLFYAINKIVPYVWRLFLIFVRIKIFAIVRICTFLINGLIAHWKLRFQQAFYNQPLWVWQVSVLALTASAFIFLGWNYGFEIGVGYEVIEQ